jgi:phosphatidylinositol alpha-1,6-mannosyltransferase
VRTLVVTNDFPPRPGGIQSFVHSYASRLPAGSVVVYASRWPGAAAFDAGQPFPVIRDRTRVLLPTPRVLRRAAQILRGEGCDVVWFGAAAPLGLLGPGLRRAGARRLVASTHGHEVGWAALPGARQLLRRISRSVDALTYLGEYTRIRLAAALGASATRLHRLPPGVDPETFAPDPTAAASLRARYALGDRPVIVCVSRLVPRKGQDMLIRALPDVRRAGVDAALLLVGGGPDRTRLHRLAGRLQVAEHVRFTGSVPTAELPAHYGAGDVFAMPCRTRLHGLDVEGLGVVYLEAAASGLPVIVGRSGGAPDAVQHGQTGYVVDPRSRSEVTVRLVELLTNPTLATAMGAAGRDWVRRDWAWDRLTGDLVALLED